uniref:Ribosomal RNA methyltransferase FtsJ domain-containing protein n=1 Tax=Spongospora subterranea TaxID=70186 RepID=A0A0H5QJ22_9EUKA|eukprot:CRZ01286.1 hypothetical protein [Spongospora subterranea]
MVTVAKPTSSRNSSVESFLVCQDYRPPSGYIPTMVAPNLTNLSQQYEPESLNRTIIPFLSCGDLLGHEDDLDADASYPLTESTMLAPIQSPIHPPYEHFIINKSTS